VFRNKCNAYVSARYDFPFNNNSGLSAEDPKILYQPKIKPKTINTQQWKFKEEIELSSIHYLKSLVRMFK